MPFDPHTRRSCGVTDIHRRLLSTDPDCRAARTTMRAFGQDDGVRSSRTGDVRRFQGVRRGPIWRLAVDGVVGRRTWAALWA